MIEPIDVNAIRDDVETLNSAVFGYWQRGERVPGLVEQTNEMLKVMKQHHDEFQAVASRASDIAWSIAKPIIVLLGVTAFLIAANLISHAGLENIVKSVGL